MDPKLKKLQKLWYKKLKADGFVDIEYNEQHLKSNSSLDISSDEFRSTEAYYEAARALLHTNYIQGRDKVIWTYHCDGCTQEEIARIMDLTQPTISRVVADIERRLIRGECY